MEWQAIELPGADLAFDPGWLSGDAATTLFRRLRDGVAWESHRIRVYGREFDPPRLSCWIGDPDARYRYSGQWFEPRPWTPELAALRDRLADELDVPFNSVLANLYRAGRDGMGWHRDAEPELGDAPVIASISLGAVRRFRLRPYTKHTVADARAWSIDLPHGSLLVMRGDTQRHYQHALPKTARAVGERINLTFRRIDHASGNNSSAITNASSRPSRAG
jgi:alkylated DNA repair dioxygenase AlkB